MAVPSSALAAARRYGPLVERIAAGYRNPLTGQRLSGAALLLKLSKGESGFNPHAVSTAGAKGETQFTPDSRAVVMNRFGVDPWRSTDEAFHAAALHLLGRVNGRKGLAGYNPGDPSYTSYILGQKVGGAGAHASSSPDMSAGQEVAQGGTDVGAPQASPGIASLLQELQSRPQQPASAGLQAPAVSAQPVMPQGARLPSGGGGPAPAPDISSLLAAIQTQGGDVPGAASQQGALPGAQGGSGSMLAGSGRVTVAKGADRAGVATKPAVLNFLDRVSALAGEALTVGTGSQHSRLTVNGSVSDHWRGAAADVPARGSRLVKLGQDALIAAGMPPAQARKQKGGLYNLGGFQIIFATGGPGVGNHHDHLHVGLRR